MGKAEMLRVLEEAEEAAAPPKKPDQTTKERRAATPPIPTTDERPDLKPVFDIPEVSSPERESMKESVPGRVSPLTYFEDSLVVSPTAAVATKYLCHMAPDRDLDLLAGASNTEAVGLFASQIASLEELKAIRAQEKKASEAMQEVLRAQVVTERAARATEEEALRAELEATLNEKTAVEAKLEETEARAVEEAERKRDEVAIAWALGKEEFLKSPEFERLCAKKSVAYFKTGLAQFRANGYSEEEHPTPFLDVKKALREMPEDDEEVEEEEEEEDA
ncbi:hypothetical protein F511_23710 [Dorcoceras hygrometricum]|uniref:Uncharacterized protein n=1 Tax=Dorcoceras hygrometricum TaxID=472368 RepID=A0A2Z7BKZ8_9LAMI|nr:hypothetical protein F511_23710 [Dorcoceras hygrometricum]